MKFVIQKNVRIPEPTVNQGNPYGRKGKYRWGDLNVGDSVHFTNTTIQDPAVKAAYKHASYHNKVFTARTTKTGVRVWRVG